MTLINNTAALAYAFAASVASIVIALAPLTGGIA